jgi:hypothetical protein
MLATAVVQNAVRLVEIAGERIVRQFVISTAFDNVPSTDKPITSAAWPLVRMAARC